MRVSRGKVLLIIVIVVVLGGCLGCWVIVSKGRSASIYGVTDPTKAALVIKNITTDFYIIGVRITREDGQSSDLREATIGEREVFPIEPGHRIDESRIAEGGREVFPIEPGGYTVKVVWCDRNGLEDMPSGFYVRSTASSEFAVGPGSAILLTLAGGEDQGARYTPPHLIKP